MFRLCRSSPNLAGAAVRLADFLQCDSVGTGWSKPRVLFGYGDVFEPLMDVGVSRAFAGIGELAGVCGRGFLKGILDGGFNRRGNCLGIRCFSTSSQQPFPWWSCRAQPPEYDFLQDPVYAPKTKKRVEYVFLFWDLDNIGAVRDWQTVQDYIEWLKDLCEDELSCKYGVEVEVILKITAAGRIAPVNGEAGVFGEKDGAAIMQPFNVHLYDAGVEKDGADKYLAWSWEKAYYFCKKNNIRFNVLLLSRDGYCSRVLKRGFVPDYFMVCGMDGTSKKYKGFDAFSYDHMVNDSIEWLDRRRAIKIDEIPDEKCHFLVKRLPNGITTSELYDAFEDVNLHSVELRPDSAASVVAANVEAADYIDRSFFWLKNQTSLDVEPLNLLPEEAMKHLYDGYFVIKSLPIGTSLTQISGAFNEVDLEFVKLVTNQNALIRALNSEAGMKIRSGSFFLPLEVISMSRRTEIFLKLTMPILPNQLEKLLSPTLPSMKDVVVQVTATDVIGTIGFYNNEAAQFSYMKILDRSSSVNKAIRHILSSVTWSRPN